MRMPQEIKQQAYEGLPHFCSKKKFSRELEVSNKAIQDRSIYIDHGYFDWLKEASVGQRKELLHRAVNHQTRHIPRRVITRAVAKLPKQLRPGRIHFRDVRTKSASGKFRMAIEKLSDIPADRPLTTTERKALFEELKDAQTRLVCAESLLEVAIENCKDELRKKRAAAAVGTHEKGFEITRICRAMKIAEKYVLREPRNNTETAQRRGTGQADCRIGAQERCRQLRFA